jgi:hypothetical protein
MSADSQQQQQHKQGRDRVAPQEHKSSTTALCVAVSDGWRTALAEMFHVLDADSAAEALRTLRVMAIDLLVVGADLPDEPFWDFVGRVRRARPRLAWILVGDVGDADEVRARCLGVLMVMGPEVGRADGDAVLARLGRPVLSGGAVQPIPADAG